jgi:hypothetical protein
MEKNKPDIKGLVALATNLIEQIGSDNKKGLIVYLKTMNMEGGISDKGFKVLCNIIRWLEDFLIPSTGKIILPSDYSTDERESQLSIETIYLFHSLPKGIARIKLLKLITGVRKLIPSEMELFLKELSK